MNTVYLFLMLLLSSQFGFTVMMIYKNFGLMYDATETTLTLIGCVMVLTFGFGRAFWMSVSWGLTFKGITGITLLI